MDSEPPAPPSEASPLSLDTGELNTTHLKLDTPSSVMTTSLDSPTNLDGATLPVSDASTQSLDIDDLKTTSLNLESFNVLTTTDSNNPAYWDGLVLPEENEMTNFSELDLDFSSLPTPSELEQPSRDSVSELTSLSSSHSWSKDAMVDQFDDFVSWSTFNGLPAKTSMDEITGRGLFPQDSIFTQLDRSSTTMLGPNTFEAMRIDYALALPRVISSGDLELHLACSRPVEGHHMVNHFSTGFQWHPFSMAISTPGSSPVVGSPYQTTANGGRPQAIQTTLAWQAPSWNRYYSLSPSPFPRGSPSTEHYANDVLPELTADASDSPLTSSTDQYSPSLSARPNLSPMITRPSPQMKIANTRDATQNTATSPSHPSPSATTSGKRRRNDDITEDPNGIPAQKRKHTKKQVDLTNSHNLTTGQKGWICPYPSAGNPKAQCSAFFPINDHAAVLRHLASHMAAEEDLLTRLNMFNLAVNMDDYVFGGLCLHYECKICGKSFGRTDSLKRHELVTTCKSLLGEKTSQDEDYTPFVTQILPQKVANQDDPTRKLPKRDIPKATFPFLECDRAAVVIADVDGERRKRRVVKVTQKISYWSDTWGLYAKKGNSGRKEIRWLEEGEDTSKFNRLKDFPKLSSIHRVAKLSNLH